MIIEPVIVIDFETTGLNTSYARATEVAAHLVQEGRIVRTFQSLINAGVPIPREVEELTGITTAMLRYEPAPHDVFPRLREFIGGRPVVAHNATFDEEIYRAEIGRLGVVESAPGFLCTMRLGRRLVPGLRSYTLRSLAESLGIRHGSRAHRAAADAEVCAHVLVALSRRIVEFGVDLIDASFLKRVAVQTPVRSVNRFLSTQAEHQARLRRKAQSAAAERSQQNDHCRGEPRRAVTVSRRWRLYAAGNLRDLEGDVLYRREQLCYVGGADPFLIVAAPQGEIRVPFGDVLGGDPRTILAFREQVGTGTPAGGVTAPRAAAVRSELRSIAAHSDVKDQMKAPPPTRTTAREVIRRKAWVFDSGTATLMHRATGRSFSALRYQRSVETFNSGYVIRDDNLPWANDNDIEFK